MKRQSTATMTIGNITGTNKAIRYTSVLFLELKIPAKINPTATSRMIVATTYIKTCLKELRKMVSFNALK